MKNFTQGSRSFVSAALLSVVLIAPAAVFAHDNYDKDNVRATGTELSVQINNNGTVRIAGAKVTAVSGSTLTAATSFGSTTVTWTVNTTASTQFVDKGGKNAALSGIAVGDVISFTGSLSSNASTLTVTATVVKDWSKNLQILQKHTFEGKLLSTIGSTTQPTTFTLQVGNTNYTVNVGATVPILNKNWATTNLSTFVAGDTVRVYGSVQAANLSMLDAVVVRNASR